MNPSETPSSYPEVNEIPAVEGMQNKELYLDAQDIVNKTREALTSFKNSIVGEEKRGTIIDAEELDTILSFFDEIPDSGWIRKSSNNEVEAYCETLARNIEYSFKFKGEDRLNDMHIVVLGKNEQAGYHEIIKVTFNDTSIEAIERSTYNR